VGVADRRSTSGYRQAPMPRRRAGEVKYVWEQSGVHVWFHYCSRESAVQIGEERLFYVSNRTHQLRGSGLYVTNRSPGELSDEDLLKELFALQRPIEAIEGVVVINRDDDLLPVRRLAPHSYIRDAEPGTTVDVTELLLGVGVRDRGRWRFDAELHVFKT
jgi:hypothetical protein